MTVRQADVARELGVSENTVSRAAAALECRTRPLSDFDAFKLLLAAELQNCGLAPHVAHELLGEFHGELRYLFGRPGRSCWIAFIESGRVSFRTASLTAKHLASVLEGFPLALVLPLHRLAASAQERLDAIRARKEAA